MPVGNIEEAREISQWDVFDTDAPEGWKIIGAGSFRKSYLSPSGVVYKLQKSDYSSDNADEYMNIQDCQLTPVPGWRVPKASLYSPLGKPIIAMEYIEGEFDMEPRCQGWDLETCDVGECTDEGRCIFEIWGDATKAWGIYDMHEENVIVDQNGTRVLIDVAG